MEPIFGDEKVAYRCSICYAILSVPDEPDTENRDGDCLRCRADAAEDSDIQNQRQAD